MRDLFKLDDPSLHLPALPIAQSTPVDERSISSCITLVDLLCQRAQQQPNRQAYTFLTDGEFRAATVTYGDLDQRARAIAGHLQELGASGERALLLHPPGLDYIAAFFGCLYAGCIAVPVYPPRFTPQDRTLSRLRSIVVDAQPVVALTTTAIMTRTEALIANATELRSISHLCIPKSSSGALSMLSRLI